MGLSDIPLYIILYSIIVDKALNNNLSKDNADWGASYLKSLIRDGLNYLERYSPGLVKSLYFLAFVKQTYQLSLPWDILLAFADFFNNNKKVSKDLILVDSRNDNVQVLNLFFSLKKIINNKSTTELKYIAEFHHESLITGIVQLMGNFNFDDILKFHMLKFLIKNEFGRTAFALFFVFFIDRLGFQRPFDHKNLDFEKSQLNLISTLQYYHKWNDFHAKFGLITSDQYYRNFFLFVLLEYRYNTRLLVLLNILRKQPMLFPKEIENIWNFHYFFNNNYVIPMSILNYIYFNPIGLMQKIINSKE